MPAPYSSSIAAAPLHRRLPDGTTWMTELTAGAAGALAALASVLTLGLIAFGALGTDAAAIGIPAAFVATVIGGSVLALIGRGPMPTGGPSSAPTLILAALVAQVVADPAFHVDHAADRSALLALCAMSVVATGVLQVGFALGGLTRVAKFVPQPVLAGFMNGVAVLFVVAQIPTLLGWPSGAWHARGWHAFDVVEPGTLAIALVTIAAIFAWPIVTRRLAASALLGKVPPTVGGLLVGCVVYAFVTHLWPDLPVGKLVGPVPRSWPSFDRLEPWLAGDATDTAMLLHRHAFAALTTALVMALIGTLDIVLNGLALDQRMKTRTAPRRELLALGVANVVSGALGGLPLQLLRARALVTWGNGGRTRVSLYTGNLLFAVLALVGTSLLALLPKIVLAGIMVVVGAMLVDAWSLRGANEWLRGRRSATGRFDLVIVATVCVVSVVFGFAVGVAIGAVLAVAVFVGSMNRSLVRTRLDARSAPSRRIYGDVHETALQRLRASILILELEGALFFGSADRLVDETDRGGPACSAVVMDLHRVTLIDASGAMVLAQIHDRLKNRGVTLLLAGLVVADRHGRALIEYVGDALPTTSWYPDADRAVEAAEVEVLRAATGGIATAAVPLSRSSLMAGLDAAQCARLGDHLVQQRVAAGERLFAQGDAGDRLYVLTEGSISVLGGSNTQGDPAGGPVRRVRFVTCSPGMMLGEVAMLDRCGRSAEAIADSDSVVHALDEAALHALFQAEPTLAALVYRNIAIHLSTRLRIASNVQVALHAIE